MYMALYHIPLYFAIMQTGRPVDVHVFGYIGACSFRLLSSHNDTYS